MHARVLMAKRGVRNVSALHRMLVAAGVEISRSQLTRIVDNHATLLNLSVVNGLMRVLDCSVQELFGEIVVSQVENPCPT